MAVRAVSRLVVVWGVLSAAYGCGGDEESSDAGKPRVCVPGTVYSCFRGGCKGTQSCSGDGTSMSRCSCLPDEPEDAGAPPRDAGEPDARSGGDCDGERRCRERAPASWSGPISLRSSDTATPSCEGTFGERVFSAGESPEAAAASCGGCSCSPAGSACAQFVDFSTSSEAGCGGTSCTTSVNQSCSEIMPPCLAGLGTAYLGTKLASGSGTCTPSKPTPELPEVKWARRVAGCEVDDAQREACASDELCLPQGKLCVYREGEHDCPGKPYTERSVYHREVEDTRSCSACSCSGPSCNYSWSVFNASDTSCASPIIKLTSAGQCVQVNPSEGKLRVGATIEGDGACTASGGESSGSVRGREAITVCCET